MVAAIFLDSDHQSQSLRTMGAGEWNMYYSHVVVDNLNKRTGKQSIQEYTEFMYDVAVYCLLLILR